MSPDLGLTTNITMSSAKRKVPAIELQRRVRARRETSEELDSASSAKEEKSSEEDSNESSTEENEEGKEDEVSTPPSR